MLRSAVALVFAFLLSACAGVRPLAPEAAARIQTVAVIALANPEYNVIGASLPPGTADDTYFGFEVDATRFAAAMTAQNLRVGPELQQAIVESLRQRGYTVTVVDFPRSNPMRSLRVREVANIQTDAVLDVSSVIAGYTDDSSGPFARARLVPHVGSATIQLMDPRAGTVLFRDAYSYGPAPTLGSGPANPQMLADERFTFASYEALMSNPSLAAEGIRAGIPKIAAALGTALAK